MKIIERITYRQFLDEIEAVEGIKLRGDPTKDTPERIYPHYNYKPPRSVGSDINLDSILRKIEKLGVEI